MARPKLTIEQFWSKGIRQGECLIWTGAVTPKGYGSVFFNGKNRRVHCVSWELTNNCSIPFGSIICHNCPIKDNRLCFEPTHLWKGTIWTNNIDKSRKGNSLTGIKHPSAKLDESKVLDIRFRLKMGERHTDIAEFYGVSRGLIGHISSGHTWKHLL